MSGTGTISVNRGESEITIVVKGRFNFEAHSHFRAAYQSENISPGPGSKRVVLDLAATDYIDSSALGMLLLLREEAGGNDADIQIINARPEIRKILETANFQRLFKLV